MIAHELTHVKQQKTRSRKETNTRKNKNIRIQMAVIKQAENQYYSDLTQHTYETGAAALDAEQFFFLNWIKNLSSQEGNLSPKQRVALLENLVKGTAVDAGFQLALRNLFVHTAEFNPPDINIGRTRAERSTLTSEYIRTGGHLIKDEVTDKRDTVYSAKDRKLYKRALAKILNAEEIQRIEEMNKMLEPGAKKHKPKKYRVRDIALSVLPMNKALHKELVKHTHLTTRLREANLGDESKHNLALYNEILTNYTGEIGLPRNALAMARILHNLPQPKKQKKAKTQVEESIQNYMIKKQDLWEIATPPFTLIEQDTAAEVEQEEDERGADQNYHDMLLDDRAQLAKDIRDGWNGETNANKKYVEVVQSDRHPSIIIRLNNVGAAQCVPLVMKAYTNAAKTLAIAIPLTERGSFGFNHPTVSKLSGNDVRIWPGVVPAMMMYELMMETLRNIEAEIERPDKKATENEESELTTNNIKPFSPDPRPLNMQLHEKTLRMAMKHAEYAWLQAEDIMSKSAQLQPLRNYIKARLTRMTQKAHYLLKTMPNDLKKQFSDHHFIRAIALAENFMEYSYVLMALQTEDVEKGKATDPIDPYEIYISRKIKAHNESSHCVVKYTDSGMQAVVTAILAAASVQELITDSGTEKITNVTVAGEAYCEIGTMANNLGLTKGKKNIGDPIIYITDPSPQQGSITHFDSTEKNKQSQGDITIVDITNTPVDRALQIVQEKQRYILVESLSKYHHLGADKYTMGRIVAVGDKAFTDAVAKRVDPIEKESKEPLLWNYRKQMDTVIYGEEIGTRDQTVKPKSAERLTRNKGERDEPQQRLISREYKTRFTINRAPASER